MAGVSSFAGCALNSVSDSDTQSSQDHSPTDGAQKTPRTPTDDSDSQRTTDEDPTVIHVATDGDDTNSGTESAPLATIQAGVDRAGPGDKVYVHPGEYRENVRIQNGGEPDAPLTLTGPADAVLKPKRENRWESLGVAASHVHLTGMTFSGLFDPEEPENPESYARTHLIYLNPNAAEDGYLDGLVVSPHRIGYAGGALINSKRIKNSEIGGFKVIGPAGAAWLFSERTGHYGEIVYLGTAADNLVERGNFEDYDHTRNVRVHHIDNSAGHPHSELVDCKEGTRNITIEYCTDAGGIQSDDSYWSQAINLSGRACTVRWNVIRDAMGSGVEIMPFYKSNVGDGIFLGEPQTAEERKMGKDHAIYGNVFTGNSADAINFVRESYRPGRESNPRPEDQRVLCGNLFDGYSDGAPGASCPSDIPTGDGVGHLGGESPWTGTAPAKEAAFDRYGVWDDIEFSVNAQNVPDGTEIKATVMLTNTGDSTREMTVRIRDRGYLITSKTVRVAADETREVQCTSSGLDAPAEVAITLNGKKIGRVQVIDQG